MRLRSGKLLKTCVRTYIKCTYKEPITAAHKLSKNICNEKLVEESQIISGHKFGKTKLESMKFLVVDSGVANSSKMLIKFGAKKENITIINYNVEDCDKLIKNNFNVVQSHLDKYLMTTTNKFDAFYLDVTNQGEYLSKCVGIIMNRRLVNHSYGVISGVFTARNRHGNSVSTIHSMIKKQIIDNVLSYPPPLFGNLNYKSSLGKRMEFFIIRAIIN